MKTLGSDTKEYVRVFFDGAEKYTEKWTMGRGLYIRQHGNNIDAKWKQYHLVPQ